MLEFLIWVLIILLFAASFIGIIMPIIPSPLMLWGGFLLYYFFIDAHSLSTIFWIAMGLLTVFLVVSDMIVNSYFVKRFGGSKLGELGAAIAVIVGSFIIPPFGVIVLPFVIVFLIELMQERTMKEAMKSSLGSLIGFLGDAFAKVLILFMMIIWFILGIIF